MVVHLTVSTFSQKKREKWEQISDDEIYEIVNQQFQDKVEIRDEIIETVPSMEELEDLLEQARLSNREALTTANQLEAILRDNRRRTILLAVIVGVCTALLLL